MNSYIREQLKCMSTLLTRVCSVVLADPIAALDNVGDDCPVFDGLFDYCSISAGGSMGTRASTLDLKLARYLLIALPFLQREQRG